MHHYFGKINRDNKMEFTESGEIAHQIWELIPTQFPFVELAEFIIMPNHVHGLLILNKENQIDALKTEFNRSKPGGSTGKNNPMLHENISRIIRWYKGRVSFEIRKKIKEANKEILQNKNELQFEWQTRFYDGIITTEEGFYNTTKYILNNPKKWNEKKSFK
jgi:putative transposase